IGRKGGSKAYAEARASVVDDLNAAVAADGKLLEAYWELACLAEMTPSGREKQRRGFLESMRAADPDGFYGLLAAGRLRALERDYRGALDQFTKAIDKKGDVPLPYLVRGRLKLITNDKTGALKDADAALEHGGAGTPE